MKKLTAEEILRRILTEPCQCPRCLERRAK